MSSQSTPDEMIIGFAPDFTLNDVDGYPLVIGGGLPTEDGGTNFYIDVQTQIDKDQPSI